MYLQLKAVIETSFAPTMIVITATDGNDKREVTLAQVRSDSDQWLTSTGGSWILSDKWIAEQRKLHKL